MTTTTNNDERKERRRKIKRRGRGEGKKRNHEEREKEKKRKIKREKILTLTWNTSPPYFSKLRATAIADHCYYLPPPSSFYETTIKQQTDRLPVISSLFRLSFMYTLLHIYLRDVSEINRRTLRAYFTRSLYQQMKMKSRKKKMKRKKKKVMQTSINGNVLFPSYEQCCLRLLFSFISFLFYFYL